MERYCGTIDGLAESGSHSASNARTGILQQIVEEFMHLVAADPCAAQRPSASAAPDRTIGEGSKANAARVGSWAGSSRRPSKSAANPRSACVALPVDGGYTAR